MPQKPANNPQNTSDTDSLNQQDVNVELMLKFQAGDADAFNKLVDNNINTVHALVYRFLGNLSHAEDITQEVFMRVYKNADRYQPTAKFSTWIYRIVANLCFNVMRSNKKKRALSLNASEDAQNRIDLPDQKSPAPEAGLAKTELQLAVKKALNELPDNQKLAIILNKYENKSYDEIAKIMSISQQAVKSLLSRARNNLKDKLEKRL